MLFSSDKTENIRDNLIKLLEASLFCMRVLEVPGIPDSIRNKESHKALYKALVGIVDINTAGNVEYKFILDQISRKMGVFTAKDSFSMEAENDSHLLDLSNCHPIQ